MGDWVEEVVVARVEARMHHGSGNTKHGSTSVLELNVELTVTLISILNLGGEWVSSWDGSGRSIVSTWKILGSSSVLAGGHGNSLSQGSEEKNLDKSKSGDVCKSREAHTVLEDISEWVVSGKIEGSWEGSSKLLNSHTYESSHGDTSVLDLDGTTTGEALKIIGVSKRIKEVKGTGVNSESIWGTRISVQGSVESLVIECEYY